MSDKWEVDYWIEDKANSLIGSFYPTIVSRDTELPLSLVFERLLELSVDKKLKLKWEIRCPDCYYTLDILDDFPNLTDGETFYCHGLCQEEKEITPDCIFPIFEFSSDYKDSIKKKSIRSKKKNRPRGENLGAISIEGEELINANSLALLQSMSPQFRNDLKNGLITINVIKDGGSMTDNRRIDYKSIGNISGINGDNINFMGDHNNFTKEVQNSDELNKAFTELVQEVKKIQDETKRNQTEFIVEQLKEAVEIRDSKKGAKLIPLIQGAIGTIGALTTIARFFGFTP